MIDSRAQKALPPIQTDGSRPRVRQGRSSRKRRRQSTRGAASAKSYYASIYPGLHRPLPLPFARAVLALERLIKKPIWLLIQDGSSGFDDLDDVVAKQFLQSRADLPTKGGVCLIVDSYGGFARQAYLLAKLFRHHCGGFTAVVPRRAKSAATLMVLGADPLVLGPYGELGPLDAQIPDPDREQVGSALDEVQTLDRLNAFAMQAMDELMFLLTPRMRKRTDIILPMVMHFVAEMMDPLLAKIDTVHFTQTSRQLKVAEEYGVRLLQPKYQLETARAIASKLVSGYPEHGFVIDADEARDQVGLDIKNATTAEARLLDAMIDHMDGMTALGRVKEVSK